MNTQSQRILTIVQADVVEPDGDHGFIISEYLLGGLLAQVENKRQRYVSGTAVPALDAAALADAIEKIEQTPGWELARAMNGDQSGNGVRAFCVWLRRGAFEIMDGRENVAENS